MTEQFVGAVDEMNDHGPKFPLERMERNMNSARMAVWAVTLVTGASIAQSAAGNPASHDHGYGPKLGAVEFPVSCRDATRAFIDEGLALLHHMTYEDSARAFAAAAAAEPDCAMSYWGEAMTYIHPLWSDPPDEAKFARGKMLVEEAKRRGKKTARESAYIAAVEAYYATGRGGVEAKNLTAFDRGWQSVHEQFPDDPEATLFYVLTQIATADPNDKAFTQQARAGEVAEKVLARYPNHPGAHHYVIHAYDYPPLAERALAVARQYSAVAPEVPHALHMPSHIYTRLGLWDESISANERSAAAGVAHAEPGKVSNHFLHALDYLTYAHLQRAEDADAEKVLVKIEPLKGPYTIQPASPYTMAAVPARLALERQQWSRAAKLEPRTPADYPWDSVPAIEAITHFARALGAARSGDAAASRVALAKLETLRDTAGKTSPYWAKQVEIERLSALAWLTYEQGDREAALKTMQDAADLEATTEKHPVTPGEVLPARELLGDMLLDLGRFDEAVAAYKQTLERRPGRFNSLFGTGFAAEKAGNMDEAGRYYRMLAEQCPNGDASRERLQQARTFLSERRNAVASQKAAP
jgi:tetratricopeptide (TPR) repeat protein